MSVLARQCCGTNCLSWQASRQRLRSVTPWILNGIKFAQGFEWQGLDLAVWKDLDTDKWMQDAELL